MLLRHVLLYLSTDKYASPYDVLLAYDAGIDEVMCYNNVSPADVRRIVRDAMLARGLDYAKYTIVFVGGQNIELVNKVVEMIKTSMFKPFTLSLIVDPKGANTIAACTVAKAEECLKEFNEKLEGKNVTILGGTGTRGTMVATICAEQGANVKIIGYSKSPERITDKLKGRSFKKDIERFTKRLSETTGKNIAGDLVTDMNEINEKIAGCDVLITTGPASLEFLPKGSLEKLNCKVAIDLNPVPPAGLGDVGPTADKIKIGNTYTVGPIVIRDLRSIVQTKLYKRAILAEGAGFFGYKEAYEIAKNLLQI